MKHRKLLVGDQLGTEQDRMEAELEALNVKMDELERMEREVAQDVLRSRVEERARAGRTANDSGIVVGTPSEYTTRATAVSFFRR